MGSGLDLGWVRVRARVRVRIRIAIWVGAELSWLAPDVLGQVRLSVG